MPAITDDDIPRVATNIRLAGELLEAHGPTLLQLAKDWANGPAAANLDPDSHQNRWETDGDGNSQPIPTDPTGEAAITPRNDLTADIQQLLRLVEKTTVELRDTIMRLVTTSTPPAGPDSWCAHHLHVGICEPRYRGDLCRWCYDFKGVHRVLPPMVLLGHRHLGKHVSKTMIEHALEADGYRLEQLGTTTKAIHKARGRTGRPDQNRKQKAT